MEEAKTAPATSTRYWIGVVSREHVQIGQGQGFAQFCHGKRGPAARLKRGDWVIYYSPKESFSSKDPCQKFTAIGQVQDDAPHQVEQAPGFNPFRRQIVYSPAREVEIRPLIENLSFIRDKSRWGMAFRYGFLEIPQADFKLISGLMLTTAD